MGDLGRRHKQLLEIAVSLAQELDQEMVVYLLKKAVLGLMECDQVVIGLRSDPDSPTLTYICDGKLDPALASERTFMPIVEQVMASGSSVVIADYGPPQSTPEKSPATAACNVAAVPLESGSGIHGIVLAVSITPGYAYTADDLGILKTLGRLAGEAFTRALQLSKYRRRDEEYQIICELAPLGIYKANEKGTMVLLNPSARFLRGHPVRDEVDQGWGHSVFPDDLDQVCREIEQRIVAREPWTLHYRAIDSTGEIRHIVDTSVPFTGVRGETGRVGYLADNNQQVQFEREARRQSSLLQLMFELGQIILDSQNQESIFQQCCEQISSRLELPLVGLVEKSQESKPSILSFCGPPGGEEALLSLTSSVFHGSIQTQGVFLHVTHTHLAVWQQLSAQENLGTLALLPLIADDQPLGLLAAANYFGADPRDGFEETITSLSVFLAMALARRQVQLELQRSFRYLVRILARAAEANDDADDRHVERVGDYSALLAAEVGSTAAFVEDVRLFAQLHDVGKALVPPQILHRARVIGEEEQAIIRSHTIHGAHILEEWPLLDMARDIALFHHEHWDGSGYPYGLRREEIPLAARIVLLADVYDTLRSYRPGGHALTHEEAVAVILQGNDEIRREHFDPGLLEAFARKSSEMSRIYEAASLVQPSDKYLLI